MGVTGEEPTLSEYMRSVAPGSRLAVYLEALERHKVLEAELVGFEDDEEPVSDALAGYELRGEIHRGGQGVVYRALQRSTKREVAVKLLLDGAALSPRRLRRFEREVEIVATLDHPNIATLHDSGVTADGRPFLVMELIDGVPADARLRRDGQPDEATTDELLRLFAKICQAVHYAHQRGVLHRDIKPGNILVDRAGEPHVLDFGLAVAVEDDVSSDHSRLTRTGEFMGTLAYASPEQVSGIPEEVDLRSDVYSLGVLLYELLTGRLPYDVSGSVVDAVQAILESPPRPPTSVRQLDSRVGSRVTRVLAGVDRELDVIAMKALAKDKSRRYQSAGELARDVERYLRGEPIQARGESTWYVLRKTVQRHKVATVAGLVIFLAMTTATVVSTLALGRARSQAAKAEEISDYLSRTLLSITPDEAKGRTVTVQNMLDEAATRLRTAEFSSREAELELTETVARTYRLISMHARALEHYAAAERLCRSVHGVRSIERADLLIGMGRSKLALGRFDDAQALFRESLELAGDALARRSAPEPDELDPRVVRGAALQGLGAVLCSEGKYLDAEEMFGRSEVDLVESSGSNSPRVASLLQSQALLLYRRGKYDAARERLERAVAIHGAGGDRDTTAVAESEHLMGDIARAQGEETRARELYQSALEKSRRLLGEDSPTTLRLRQSIVISGLRLEGHAAVQEEYRALLALGGEIVATDASHAGALDALGSLALEFAEYGRAEALYRRALDLYSRIYAEDTFERNATLGNLGWCLIRQGRMAEARETCGAAVETVRRLLGPGTRWEAMYLAQLAWTHADLGDSARAVEDARAALDIFRTAYPPSHPRIAQQLIELGLFRFIQGDTDGAEEIFREARALREEHGDGPDQQLAAANHCLGEVKQVKGELDAAREYLELGLELRTRLLAANHPDRAESLNTLAMTRYLLGDHTPEVRAMYEEALEILRAQGTPYPRMTFVLGNLGAWELVVEKDIEAAAEYYDQAIEHAEATSAHNYPLYGHVLAGRAVMHGRAGEHDRSVELLERAYAQMSRDPNARLSTTPQVLDMLIHACEQAGDTEKAARYREQTGADPP